MRRETRLLPIDFNDWHWVDQDGETVIESLVNYGMPGRPDRASFFNLKIQADNKTTPGHPAKTVAEYILDEENNIQAEFKGILKAEVLAWMAAQQIKDRPNISAQASKPIFKK